MLTCPHCGHASFTLTREITVIQTLHSCRIDEHGNWDEAEDDLGDTVDSSPFTAFVCAACDRDMDLAWLNRQCAGETS